MVGVVKPMLQIIRCSVPLNQPSMGGAKGSLFIDLSAEVRGKLHIDRA